MYFFTHLDKDNDSEISWNEFLAFHVQAFSMFSTAIIDASMIKREFSNLDHDGSGKISRKQFIQAIKPLINHE